MAMQPRQFMVTDRDRTFHGGIAETEEGMRRGFSLITQKEKRKEEDILLLLDFCLERLIV
jgi:hypothetical protein